MPIRPEDVPADPARLAAMVLALDAENERLREIVRTLKDLLSGARAERAAVIDVAQLPLDLDDLAVGPTPPPLAANDEVVAERKGGQPRRPAGRNSVPVRCAGEGYDLPEVRLPDLGGSNRSSQEPAPPGRGR